jgi:hypothetical protein
LSARIYLYRNEAVVFDDSEAVFHDFRFLAALALSGMTTLTVRSPGPYGNAHPYQNNVHVTYPLFISP